MGAGHGFEGFCEDIFSSMGRADQRRAGEIYLHGLLGGAGRKSVRGLAAATAGCSEQSLQQFISRSPWDPVPVRRRLTRHLVGSMNPTAYVIDEVAFPKCGRHSVAVERQYVRSQGRVRNCQLAVAAMVTDSRFSVPVGWRLVVPDSWGTDRHRRDRTRMPADELPRPHWQYQVEVLDDLIEQPGTLTAPVLADGSNRLGAEAFIDAIEQRCPRYLVQVSSRLHVSYRESPARPTAGGPPWSTPGGSATARRGALDQLVARIADPVRDTVEWCDDGVVLRSQFFWLPVRAPAQHPPGSRVLLCEWPAGRPQPRHFWITNIVDRPLADLVALAKAGPVAGRQLEQLADGFGLRDYAGRTFTGWHHHVTLVAAAYTYHVLATSGRFTL
jgi:hypothetical protein